jgi:hypothetical protein
MKFGNEFWLILFREYISPNLFAVRGGWWGEGVKTTEKKYIGISKLGGGGRYSTLLHPLSTTDFWTDILMTT